MGWMVCYVEMKELLGGLQLRRGGSRSVLLAVDGGPAAFRQVLDNDTNMKSVIC